MYSICIFRYFLEVSSLTLPGRVGDCSHDDYANLAMFLSKYNSYKRDGAEPRLISQRVELDGQDGDFGPRGNPDGFNS